jgi:membrane associated rhomboid family serine protease
MSPYGPPPTPQFPSPSTELSPFSRDPAAAATTMAPNVGYSSFMNSPNAVRPTGLNRPGATQMLWGFGVAVIGVIITGVTWAIAAPGGTFIVAWGAIVFGTIRGIAGAVRMNRS